MKKKVLFFTISKAKLSGGPNMIYNAIKHIDKKRYDVEVLAQFPCPLTTRLIDDGITVHYLPMPKARIRAAKVKELFWQSLFDKIKVSLLLLIYSIRVSVFAARHGFDIVWCENLRALLSVAALRFSTIKLVFNMWSNVNSRIGLHIITWLSDHIVVEAEFQRDLFEKLAKKPPISVINTQLDEDIFTWIKSKEDTSSVDSGTSKVVGHLGGARYSKGYDIFIDVAYELIVNRKLRNVSFYVAGIQDNDDLLEDIEIARKLQRIREYIKFSRWISEKADFYNNIDIFVSVSRSEGLPGAVREAMAFGLPVVATDVGGSSEALGETGLLVSGCEKNRIVEECSNHIETLVMDSAYARRLGEKARQRALEKFIGANWVRKLESVFCNVSSSGEEK